MNNRRTYRKTLSLVLVSGMLLSVPTMNSEAAVITSNATDKTAVVFNENTAYSAGDYITYDGEMFICTDDIQGAWSSAKENFMQITKNHELGNSGDLSVAYDASADPTDEKSLMAFVANAWQKLKGFLGTENKAAQIDQSNYKNASVSAKLNFLEEQNEDLDADVAKLQEHVNQSFQSVSDGKSLLANTITGKGVTVRQDAKFPAINAAILDMAQLQYDNGQTAGYNSGHADGYNTGYAQGHTAGKAAGIEEADKRVNTNSESYQQGLKDANTKIFSLRTCLSYYEISEGESYFTYGWDQYGNKVRSFSKSFEGHTIIGVRAYEFSHTNYSSGSVTHMALLVNDTYWISSDESYTGIKGDKIIVTNDTLEWNNFGFSSYGSDSDYTELYIDVVYI